MNLVSFRHSVCIALTGLQSWRRKLLGWAACALACIIILLPIAAMAQDRSLSFAALEAAHAEPGSRFMEIDGLRVHYTDEGSGPAVILLNASYLNLSSWRDVAAQLTDGTHQSHRVIRLDFPTIGLTGPAPAASLDINAFDGLVIEVMDRLSVEKATLVGTSSGGIVAFRLAASQPERFERLVLVNAAGLPRTAATNPIRQQIRAADAPPIGSLAFWLDSLRNNFADPARVKDDFARQIYDFNRREGIDQEAQVFISNFTTGRPQDVLSQIRIPTLIIWGEMGITLSHLEAEAFLQWLVNAPGAIRKYPDAGHYPQVEQPAKVSADIASFIAGKMDAMMRPPPGQPASALADVAFWRANAGLWLGENAYLTASGERQMDPYSSLTENRLEGDVMEQVERVFYGSSDLARAMAGEYLRDGEGVEIRRVVHGRLADTSGKVRIEHSSTGVGQGDVAEIQPFTASTGLLSVRPVSGGPDRYRIHIDLPSADNRIRTTLGLDDGSTDRARPGALRAMAVFRETRQDPSREEALIAELRMRHKVKVIVEFAPDGSKSVRRLSE